MITIDLTLQRNSFQLTANLSLASQASYVILGESGVGKTTFLRSLAGFVNPNHGKIVINNQTWLDSIQGINQPTPQRSVILMSQKPYLFPHLTVEQNYQLISQWKNRPLAKNKRTEVFEKFGVKHWLQRYPNQLSGGQLQRVALVYALLTEPDLMLLDEPLSALDPETKAVMVKYLKQYFQQSSSTIFYVTHNLQEAEVLADVVLEIKDGRLTPKAKILRKPDLESLANKYAITSSRHSFPRSASLDPGYIS